MAIELEDRRKALEEVFFQKENAALVQKMREKREGEAARAELVAATGISDEALLSALLAQGVDSHTLTALSLVPVVAVAWASGKVEIAERKTILEAAAESGVQPGQPSYELLQSWLETRPAERLLEAWSDYAAQLCSVLDQSHRERFASEVLERAKKVARAAGGVAGIGSISSAERAVLDRLKAVLTK